MRKNRKTIAAKRIAAKTVTGVPKFFGVLNDPLGNQIEGQLMEKEEAEQRKVDRFWGQDKDLYDRELENIAMGIEDEESLRNEQQYEQIALHRRWDEEFHRLQWIENKMVASHREAERNEHLRLVTSSESSGDVIGAVWNRRDPEETDGDPLKLNMSAAMQQQQNMLNDSTSASSVSNIAPSSLDAIHMSVHLDGLQKSRAIIDKASFEFKQTLRRINTQSEEENEAVEPFKTNPFNTALLKKKKKLLHQQLQQRTSIATVGSSVGGAGGEDNAAVDSLSASTTAAVPASVLNFEAASAHAPAIDGHISHRWDQDAMLRAAFTMMDSRGRGWLLLEDVAAVSYNSQLHELLRYTVFWCFIKKRQWDFFSAIFLAGDAPRPPYSSSEQSRGGPAPDLEPLRGEEGTHFTAGGKINMSMWLGAAECVAREPNVPLRWIRTNEEHLRLESKGSDSPHLPGNATGPVSSSESKSPLSIIGLPERESRISRVLGEGDCVWALHRGGCLWLPAVIITIHRHSPSQPFTYDLWYPLSERELQRARSMTTARHLLALPSQEPLNRQAAGMSRSDMSNLRGAPAQPLAAKPLSDERSVCAYAFDLADNSGAGIVPLKRLVRCMQSVEFSKIVATSLPLRIIFSNTTDVANANRVGASKSSGGLSSMEIPSLLPVFIDTFSAQPEEAKQHGHTAGTGGGGLDGGGSSSTAGGYSEEAFESQSSAGLGNRRSATREGAGPAGSSVAAPDWISKLDFLEFCQAVIDIKKYSVAGAAQ